MNQSLNKNYLRSMLTLIQCCQQHYTYANQHHKLRSNHYITKKKEAYLISCKHNQQTSIPLSFSMVSAILLGIGPNNSLLLKSKQQVSLRTQALNIFYTLNMISITYSYFIVITHEKQELLISSIFYQNNIINHFTRILSIIST